MESPSKLMAAICGPSRERKSCAKTRIGNPKRWRFEVGASAKVLTGMEQRTGIHEVYGAATRDFVSAQLMSARSGTPRLGDADSRAAISLTNVWKIFGQREFEARKAIQDGGISKSDVMRRFDCV